jgi:hypothetical protein
MDVRRKRFEKVSANRLIGGFTMLTLLVGTDPACVFAQQQFASAQHASRALFVAVKNGDERALARILGAGKALISAEDPDEDRSEREQFVTKYQQMHRLVREPDQTTVLYVGAENWPFPVPLVNRHGAWSFDAETGMREVLYRGIGENEANALEACHALAVAKRQYEEVANQDGEPPRYHGYYFRILSSRNEAPGAQSGTLTDDERRFIVVAYPVEYRKTGVVTFMVTDDDVVYETDLGPNTKAFAKAINAHDSKLPWRRAE